MHCLGASAVLQAKREGRECEYYTKLGLETFQWNAAEKSNTVGRGQASGAQVIILFPRIKYITWRAYGITTKWLKIYNLLLLPSSLLWLFMHTNTSHRLSFPGNPYFTLVFSEGTRTNAISMPRGRCKRETLFCKTNVLAKEHACARFVRFHYFNAVVKKNIRFSPCWVNVAVVYQWKLSNKTRTQVASRVWNFHAENKRQWEDYFNWVIFVYQFTTTTRIFKTFTCLRDIDANTAKICIAVLAISSYKLLKTRYFILHILLLKYISV